MSIYISDTKVGTTPVLVPGPVDVPKVITAYKDIWLGGPTVTVGSGVQIAAGRAFTLSPGTWYVVCNSSTELDVRIPTPSSDFRAEQAAFFGPGDIYGENLAEGCMSVSNRNTSTSFTSSTGLLSISCFKAPKSFIVNNIAAVCSSVAAGATPTLVRFGLWRVNEDESLTLIGSTPNDTSLFSTINTRYVKALSAPVSFQQGGHYGAGILIVTAATAPTVIFTSGGTASSLFSARKPKTGVVLGSQTDLPAEISNVFAGVNVHPVLEILP